MEFDRVETALTVGYRITDQFSTFFGFRYADVDFDGSGSLGAVDADFSTEMKPTPPQDSMEVDGGPDCLSIGR